MDREIARWVEFWDFLDGNFWGLVHWFGRELTLEELGWQPVPTVASIGWNLWHLGEMLDHYMHRVFSQSATIHPEPLVTMTPGRQDDGRFGNLKAIIAYHEQVRPEYREFLSQLSGEDLGRAIERHGRRAITFGWAVAHIHEHESYHLGKCTLLQSWIMARRNETADTRR